MRMSVLPLNMYSHRCDTSSSLRPSMFKCLLSKLVSSKAFKLTVEQHIGRRVDSAGESADEDVLNPGHRVPSSLLAPVLPLPPHCAGACLPAALDEYMPTAAGCLCS